jgi:hypothetical protein
MIPASSKPYICLCRLTSIVCSVFKYRLEAASKASRRSVGGGSEEECVDESVLRAAPADWRSCVIL